MARLQLENIKKVYDNSFEAVQDLCIDIQDGEFLSLVGPSGCAKSTTLRMIAGLEDITGGVLRIGDVVANDLPSKDRGIAMVFQSYALFPHMSVAANVGFGLKIQKVPLEVRKEKIKWALDLVDLNGLDDRKPSELSGGQRQRVALARAIVLEPKVLLLDEPLSNLDAKLRIKMRVELKRIHQKLGATIVYVTHDQSEAMTLSDRIAIMNRGELMQIGTPTEIYNNPNNKFVAGFIGSPSMNFISGLIEDVNGKPAFSSRIGSIIIPDNKLENIKKLQDLPVSLGIRPEDITISRSSVENSLPGKVIVRETLGSDDFLAIELNGYKELVTVRVQPEEIYPLNETIYLEMNMDKIHFFNEEEN